MAGGERIASAMILAAGLGTRLRPITETTPKPLVRVAGRSMIDWLIDRLERAGVERVVVNVHHLADRMEAHLSTRATPEIVISDERARLLDSGGGVRRALPALGDGPFFVLNADSIWIEGARPNLTRLAEAWRADRHDMLMLVAPTATSVGYDGRGDFAFEPDGRLRRRREREVTPFVYAGALIATPALFADAPEGPFSLNLLFDRAAEAGRLHGVRLDGVWLHVGDPLALAEAEAAVAASAQ